MKKFFYSTILSLLLATLPAAQAKAPQHYQGSPDELHSGINDGPHLSMEAL